MDKGIELNYVQVLIGLQGKRMLFAATVVGKDIGLGTALVQDKDEIIIQNLTKKIQVGKRHKAKLADRPNRETVGPRTPQRARF